MVALLTENLGATAQTAELPQPDPFPGGGEPEERLIICGLSWKSYLAFDKKLGDDRPGPRFYYLDGELEVMSTSPEHERIKTWIGDFLADYFFEKEIEVMHRGQATLRKALKRAGAEPDESWCIGSEKEHPDMVLEIALTSGGVNKLEIYRRFSISEVWFWRRDKLEIFILDKAKGYQRAGQSRLLADLDTALLERCVAIRSWTRARKEFRAGLRK